MRRIALLLVTLAFVLVPCGAATAAPTWLAPDPVSGGDSGVADVAVAPNGRAVVVWSTDTDAVQASVREPGGSWSAFATLGQSNGCCPEGQVAMDAAGRAIAVYNVCTPNPGSTCDVFARTLAPAATAWSAAQEISGTTIFPEAPQIAVDPAGNALIGWIDRHSNGFDYLAYARYRSAGGALDAGVSTLSANSGCCMQLSVAMAGEGTGIVTWSHYTASGFVQARTRSAAGTWTPALASPAQALSPGYSTSFAYDPQASADPVGNGLVTWRAGDGTIDSRARSTAGSWGPEVPLTGAASTNGPPWPALDGDGLATVAWCGAGPTPGSFVVKVRRRPVGAAFAPEAAISEPGTFKCSPRVSAGPGGAALVIWRIADGLIRGNIRPPGGDFGAARDISKFGGAQYASGAFDAAGNAVVAWHRGLVVEAAAYDASPPEARNLVVPASATAGVPVAMSVNPFDIWSAVGATWDFGDGTGASGASVSHAFASAGQYTVRVTLTDAVGNATSAQGTVVVTNPPPGPGELDGDGDGFRSSQDCDDTNPAIRPGGKEIPGNDIDEDCNGVAAPTPRITAGVTWDGRLDRRKRAVFVRLRVVELPRNATVQLRCSGTRCPFKRKTARRRAGTTALNLLPTLGRTTRLAPGLTFEVWITAPQTIGKVVRFRTTRRKFPTGVAYCVPVGSQKPQRRCT